MSVMPVIQDYAFGKMTIGHKAITSDLVIFPDGSVADNWYRKQGHLLVRSDIVRLLEQKPDCIVIGTGSSGGMKVDKQLSSLFNDLGIQAKAAPCTRAVQIYNDLAKTGVALGACFHLTC